MKKPVMPRMAAALMPREITTWSLNALALGAVEGGLLGVVVKSQFADAAAPAVVNFAAAVVAGAPAFTNLASFAFAAMAHGRDKLEMLHRLIQAMGLCLLLMAAVPGGGWGLFLFCLGAVAARTAWTGILTVRAAVWRANYQREWRARVTGRIVQLSSLLVAASAALCGWLLEWHSIGLRVALVAAAIASLLAARHYRRARVRRQRLLLRAELAEQSVDGGRMNLRIFRSVLSGDRDFRNYMHCMMVFGGGNLMLIPMLVVMLSEELALPRAQQVLVTSSIPLVVLCFCVPWWARLLDKRHIFGYRAVHSWFYVAANFFFTLALVSGAHAALWLAAVLLGCANAGGHLGWNLGHDDFSSDANAAHYMAVHVTLTGLRGLVMPLLGVGFYQLLLMFQPAWGAWALVLPLALNVAGAIAFVVLSRRRDTLLVGQRGGR